MSEPSIADEQFQYFINEVRARCDMNDIYALARRLLEERLENNSSFTREELIDNYLLHTNREDLIALIADAIKRREIDYD